MTTKTSKPLTHYGEIERDSSMGGPYKIILCGERKARDFSCIAREVTCPKCLAAIAAEGIGDPGPLSDEMTVEYASRA